VARKHGQVQDEQLDAEREVRRRLALAQIRQYPDPVLRMRANDVERFDDELRSLVERMKILMRDANGVGLAATQIGVLQRVFVWQPSEAEEPAVVVNPALTASGPETGTDEEGCLSLQGVLVPVERTAAVRLTAKDESGADVELDLEGHDARVVQHELDHLDGVLMLDRTTPEARREAMGILRPRPMLDLR